MVFNTNKTGIDSGFLDGISYLKCVFLNQSKYSMYSCMRRTQTKWTFFRGKKTPIRSRKSIYIYLYTYIGTCICMTISRILIRFYLWLEMFMKHQSYSFGFAFAVVIGNILWAIDNGIVSFSSFPREYSKFIISAGRFGNKGMRLKCWGILITNNIWKLKK